MSVLLIKNADLVVTMDEDRQELSGCDVLVRDNVISEVGPNLEAEADETLDARGCIVIPGLINSHNHMWGTLYRAWPEIQDVHGDEWFAAFARAWHDNPVTPRRALRRCSGQHGPAPPHGLHDECRPSLDLPQGRANRFRRSLHRRCPRDRDEVPSKPRLYDDGGVAWRQHA